MNGRSRKILLALSVAAVLCGCGAKENEDARGRDSDGGRAASVGNAGSVGNTESGNPGSARRNGNTPEVQEPFDQDLVSDEYLVGFDYFTGDFLEYAPTLIVKVRYDGRLEVGFDHTLSNGDIYTETVFFDLSDQQYRDIEAAIRLKNSTNWIRKKRIRRRSVMADIRT